MTDIRNLGGPGKAVFDTAERLKGAKLIDDAQFQELTNDKVGPQDVAIGNQALDKLKSDTPDAMKLLFDIPKMNNNVIELQKQALQKTVSEAKAAAPAKAESADKPEGAQGWLNKFLESVGVGAKAVQDFFREMPSQQDIIRNIRA